MREMHHDTIALIFLICTIHINFIYGNVTYSKRSVEQPTVDQCPSLCSCQEARIKPPKHPAESSTLTRDVFTSENVVPRRINVSNAGRKKGRREILKVGIKMQCQNPAVIVSIKKLNMSSAFTKNVVQFDLSGNSLAKLTADDFANLDYQMLQKLILKNNQIENVEPNTFTSLKSLKLLDLSNNHLTKFNPTTVENLSSIERLKLGGNPIICDCNLRKFYSFFSKRNIRVHGTCSEPELLKDRPLSQLAFEDLSCDWSSEEDIELEIKPTTNQIVFEGDPLKLSCKLTIKNPVMKLIWTHQTANQSLDFSIDSNVSVASHTRAVGDVSVVESTLQITHLQILHAGSWVCSAVLESQNITTGSRSVDVTVLSLSTPTCVSDITTSNKGRFAWPRTMAGLKIHLPCQSNPHVQASRFCNSQGIWEEPDLNGCSYLSEVTKVLEQFAKTNLTFSKTSALESARRFKDYLNDIAYLEDPHNAIFVTQTLYNYLDATGKHPELLPMIMDVYSVLLKQDPAVLIDCRHAMLGIVQQAPLKSPEFRYQSSNFATEKCKLLTNGKSVFSETCTWKLNNEALPAVPGVKNLSKLSTAVPTQRNKYIVECFPANLTDRQDVESAVQIPLAVEGVPLMQQTVVLSLFLSTNVFINGNSPWLMVTSVLGITSGHVTNLINRTVPFVITLRLLNSLKADRIVGARWDPYADEWNLVQCGKAEMSTSRNSSYVTFECCCGFGYFAAFVPKIQEELVAQLEDSRTPVLPTTLLPPPIYVGSTVCVLCHVPSILCYLIHHRLLRMTRPTKHALINMWISVTILVVVFTVGIRPVFGRFPCQIVGLILHYSTLSSLLWMVVISSSFYKHLSKSIKSDRVSEVSSVDEEEMVENPGDESQSKPALRFYLIGWGVPLIVVGIAGAIHLEQYASADICFLAKTPSLGAVGLPAAILVFLVLTFHLLAWCYLRHTERIQKQLAINAAMAMEAEPSVPLNSEQNAGLWSDNSAEEAPPLQGELTICVLNQSKDGYLPLLGDGGSCPSNLTNLTQMTQVTELSDLTSGSGSGNQEQERIALLINRSQRGEAEGAQSANEANSGRSDIERPLLMVTPCNEGRPAETSKDIDDSQGHSNPLMTSFTEDMESKKEDEGLLHTMDPLDCGGSPSYTPTGLIAPFVDNTDERCPLFQLRGQLVFLILFCLMWISAVCVVTRPLKDFIPYDELFTSLCYAVLSTAVGLHTLVFHVLTRRDVQSFCCAQKKIKDDVQISVAIAPASISVATLPSPVSENVVVQPPALLLTYATPTTASSAEPVEADPLEEAIISSNKDLESLRPTSDATELNVSIDPVTLVNSFYDPRQSKTARRFFQKQKLLNQTQNNQRTELQRNRDSRHLNNMQVAKSHSPISEDALFNVNSSSKAKVSNVNIHVELGAYDWHELQTRNSDQSWSKSGKQLPTKSRNSDPPTITNSLEVAVDQNVSLPRSDRSKRKRHGHHHRSHKKSKWDDQFSVRCPEKPVYVFVNYDYCDKALAQVSHNDEALKTLTAIQIKVKDDNEQWDFIKKETSV